MSKHPHHHHSRKPAQSPKKEESFPSTVITMPEPVNPLAAELPAKTEEELPVGNHSLPGANPSEFDPELSEDPFHIDPSSLPHIEPEHTPEEEAEILANTPPTGIDHLGRPAKPDFDPRDPSMGFYQGIDPQTGKRVYSK
jgi:hypothetical protein